MSSATIKRGGPPPRRAKAKSSGRSLKRVSRLDRFIAALPVSEATLQKLASWAIVALALAAVAGLGVLFGVPQAIADEFSVLASRAGFEVKKVEVHGIERMDELPVYSIALGQHDRAMPAVDLDKVRGDLMQLGWVEDARVSRRLPDTLVVDIVERQPAAIWQHEGKLSLIDAKGVVLEAVDVNKMPDLPLVVGPDANKQAVALGALMDAAPALKPMLAGATWVGDRRWDLRFQSGELLSLPEGVKESATALVNFARMDGVNRLLGRGIVRFDMRDPDKFVLRLPKDRPAAQAAESKDTTDRPTAAQRDEEG